MTRPPKFQSVKKNIWKRTGSLLCPQILLPTDDTAVSFLGILPKMYCDYLSMHTIVVLNFFSHK